MFRVPIFIHSLQYCSCLSQTWVFQIAGAFKATVFFKDKGLHCCLPMFLLIVIWPLICSSYVIGDIFIMIGMLNFHELVAGVISLVPSPCSENMLFLDN
uniref:Uncharacterized protein n=1 Tax=Rhizophora mucronata TaxID=61149 RepID=A0A2P2N3T3_RHIMU